MAASKMRNDMHGENMPARENKFSKLEHGKYLMI